MPKIDLISPDQRRRLKVLRLVATVAGALVAAAVIYAFLTHWAIGLAALFAAPVVVYAAVVLFEAIIPGD